MNDHTQFKKQKNLHNSILSEDGALRFDFMTSLQNIVMAKIIVHLWTNQKTELLKLTSIPIYKTYSEKWDGIEKNVVSRVSELPLPKSLTKKLANIVPIIGDSILNWIRYNYEFIFNGDKFYAVEQIINLAWTARGKVDYAQTARNIISNRNSTLSNKNKYELACTYCLEEEIHILAENVLNRFYLSKIDIGTDTMVGFWTNNFKDNIILFCPLDFFKREFRYLSINEKIFRILTKSNRTEVKKTWNEVAITYIWNKLNEEEKARNIISLFKALSNQDLRYSLLSSLDYEQQQNVFKECSGIILGDILNDWLWGEYFLPTALQTLHIMEPLVYVEILNKIIKEMNSSYDDGNKSKYKRYKYTFKQIWQTSPRALKYFFFGHRNGYFVQNFLITSLSRNRDMDIIELILNDSDSFQKRNLVFRNNGIFHCARFIQRGRLDLTELFIQYTLSSEMDIKYLKRILVKDKGQEIALKLVTQDALRKAEQFLRWCFETEEEVDKFRLSLADSDNLLKSIIDKSNADYVKIEKLFMWCCNGDQEMMNILRKKFPKSVSGRYLILKLIDEDNYELVDEFLNWCFLNNRKHILLFKRNLYKDERFFAIELVLILRNKEESLKMLSKFIHWSFTKEKGIQKITSMFFLPPVSNIGTSLLDTAFLV